MKAVLILGFAVTLAFALGFYGGSQRGGVTIGDGRGGGSYTGGFESSDAPTGVAAVFEGGKIHVVEDGDSIQAAVNAAADGDTIRVMPGTYRETVYIDKDGIRLIGVIEAGARPTLEGEGRLNDAVLYSGNNIVVENLKITRYKGNAIMGQAGNNFEIRNNLIVDTGVYGVFPQLGTNGIVEGNIITGNQTAGILVVDHANASNVTADPESDPTPDRVAILDNFMMNNGYETIPEVRALMLAELKGGKPDIVRAGEVRDSCITNRHRYRHAGLGGFSDCSFDNTDTIESYLFPEPVAARAIDASEQGEITYLGICTGCHAYTGRLVGPPVQVIQALYMDRPAELAAYIAAPTRKRDDYPEMPPQDYLSEDVRLAVAEYMLGLDG